MAVIFGFDFLAQTEVSNPHSEADKRRTQGFRYRSAS